MDGKNEMSNQLIPQTFPLISVIIPVYNTEKYLQECVDSVMKQTYQNLEILLIDDGSTDTSAEICDAYERFDQRITTLHKENGGLSDARNFGIKNANGDYLCFIDSDDFISENFIEKLFESITKTHSDISFCNFVKFFPGKNKKIGNYHSKDLYENREDAIRGLFSGEIRTSAWAKLYKKSIFDSIQFPEGEIAEDIMTLYNAFCTINKISFTKKGIYFYRQNTTGITRTKTMALFNILKTKFKEIDQDVQENFVNLQKNARGYFVRIYIGTYSLNCIFGKQRDPSEYQLFKTEVIQYLPSVLQLSLIEMGFIKIRTIVFLNFPIIYDLIYKLYYLRQGIHK
jgi:glycosyltransferase involved in cell wall biosynthesis